MTKVHKVYVVYKRSVYGKFILDESNKHLISLLNEKHHTTKHLLSAHERNLASLEEVEKVLKDLNLKYKISGRSNVKNLQGYNLIVTLGGDGTFLRTSHHVNDQPIIGINSTPKYSVGKFCSINSDEFSSKMRDILEGNYKVQNLHRIQILINGAEVPVFPVNDVLFTNNSPAATSRYIISADGVSEEHKSSGIWISTPAGSTAAISAAGGVGQKHKDNRLQYITREPYQGIYSPYKITHGFVDSEKEIKIESKMIKSRIYLDGPTKFFTLNFGDELVIKMSPKILRKIL